jgi:hypothetical protein
MDVVLFYQQLSTFAVICAHVHVCVAKSPWGVVKTQNASTVVYHTTRQTCFDIKKGVQSIKYTKAQWTDDVVILRVVRWKPVPLATHRHHQGLHFTTAKFPTAVAHIASVPTTMQTSDQAHRHAFVTLLPALARQ